MLNHLSVMHSIVRSFEIKFMFRVGYSASLLYIRIEVLSASKQDLIKICPLSVLAINHSLGGLSFMLFSGINKSVFGAVIKALGNFSRLNIVLGSELLFYFGGYHQC